MGHPIVKINISRSLGTQEHCCITDNGLVSLEKVFPNLHWFFFTDESWDSWEQLRSFSLPSHVNSLYFLPKARASCFLKGIDIINVLDMYLGWSMDPNILLGSLMFSLPMTLWSTEVLSLDSQWWKNNMGDKNSHGVFCHELQNIFLCFELFFFFFYNFYFSEQSMMQDQAPFVSYRLQKGTTGIDICWRSMVVWVISSCTLGNFCVLTEIH